MKSKISKKCYIFGTFNPIHNSHIKIAEYLLSQGKAIINNVISAFEFIKRPDIDFNDVSYCTGVSFEYDDEVIDQVQIEIKYEGYIAKAYREANKLKQMENRKIPEDIDYSKIKNLAHEACEKLEKIRPTTLAQASRISGVNPSDVEMILVYLESRHRQ